MRRERTGEIVVRKKERKKKELINRNVFLHDSERFDYSYRVLINACNYVCGGVSTSNRSFIITVICSSGLGS